MAGKTEIITHLTYTELFKEYERSGIALPSNALKTPEDVSTQIIYLLQNMNPVELIQFSSFLNMICQTYGSDMAMTRGVTLLKETKLIPADAAFKNRILFHRENLLNLIGQILRSKISGTEQLTGPEFVANQQKYTKSLLLNNDLLNVMTNASPGAGSGLIMKDYFIREWPHYYSADTSKTINGTRIVRYRYCYENLLPTLDESKRKIVQDAIHAFEQHLGVSLSEYLHVVAGLYGWYLEWPINREKNLPNPGDPVYGFDFKNIDSFYISVEAFKEDPVFLKTIEALSKDITSLQSLVDAEITKDKDPITGFNSLVRVFFDNPVFKISDDHYCIIDLKFVLENVCGGLLWRLRTDENIQDFKSAYGYMMEEYFRFLITKIFDGADINFGINGGADAIIETENHVIVIEFTTEYYRMFSLYSELLDGFLDDAYRILFNAGPEDERGRSKSDKGKLIKLDGYIETAKKDGKTVIPVLVTENLIGNPDLFDTFANFYSDEVKNKELNNLIANKPLFMNLDDLETFWALFDTNELVSNFVGFAEFWNPLDKGPRFHNACTGISEYVETVCGRESRIANKEYADFFAPKNIYK